VNPLHFGTAAQFAAGRQLLVGAGYTEEALRARYGLNVLSEFKTLRQGRAPADAPQDALGLLIHLFLDTEFVTRAQITSLLTPGAIECLAALGLVSPAPSNCELWAGTVMLYPRGPIMLASDREPRRPRPVRDASSAARS